MSVPDTHTSVNAMTATELVYNPYAFAIHDDPYETYRRLRDEAPAYWNPDLSFWVLSRFEDVQNAFKDLTHSHQPEESRSKAEDDGTQAEWNSSK